MNSIAYKPYTVFHVDDDADDRELFQEAISEVFSQISVTSIEDCANLATYLKQTPDLIFLDINMPGKNGIECLKEIRSENRFDKLPIVMLSTSSRPEDIMASYNNGANIYVTKPFTFRDFTTLINKIISFYRI